MKKKKPKEHPQPSRRDETKQLALASEARLSAGSKRKLEEVVDHDMEPSVDNVRIHDGDNPTEKKRKRRKKSDSEPQHIVDVITSGQ